MRCTRPIQVRSPYDSTGRTFINVPCGVCYVCLQNRRQDWTIRLIEEAKAVNCVKFVTLTYNEEFVSYSSKGVNTLVKRDMQLYIKRLRKSTKEKIRYYAVGEYGTKTKRPHFHCIVFANVDLSSNIVDCWIGMNESTGNWESLGNVVIAPSNERRLGYICKYHVNKGSYPCGASPPFALMSKGIGRNYLEKMKMFHEGQIDRSYYQDYELKKRLPRYFKEKIYTRDEREKIAGMVSDDDFSIDKIEEFKKKYPNGNYFKHKFDQFENLQRKYKEKSSINQKL